MPDMEFRIMVYLFIFCKTLFLNSYYSVDHQYLSFVDDVTFEGYLWVVDVHEEILAMFFFVNLLTYLTLQCFSC